MKYFAWIYPIIDSNFVGLVIVLTNVFLNDDISFKVVPGVNLTFLDCFYFLTYERFLFKSSLFAEYDDRKMCLYLKYKQEKFCFEWWYLWQNFKALQRICHEISYSKNCWKFTKFFLLYPHVVFMNWIKDQISINS